LLVQTMVLLTPTTTVIVAGLKLADMLSPTPAGMYTVVVTGVPVDEDEDVVEVDDEGEDEDEIVVVDVLQQVVVDSVVVDVVGVVV